MIANYAACDVHPGSMGQPMPGITAGVLQRGEEGRAQAGPDGHVAQVPAGEIGELALRTPWPSMFRAYLDEELGYNKCFVDGWYLTGDLAKRDEDGYFWFVGRADDVIKTAGHLIGPFEVESVLMEDTRVAEAGVIGVPDEARGQIVKAYVVLKPGRRADAALTRELQDWVKGQIAPYKYPRSIEYLDALPRTETGKLQRFKLRS